MLLIVRTYLPAAKNRKTDQPAKKQRRLQQQQPVIRTTHVMTGLQDRVTFSQESSTQVD